MSNPARPVSPHLSVYRWPITMTLSILHRSTGVALSIGFVALTCWLVSAASGRASYDSFMALLETLPGRLLLIGWSFAFFFHLSNGVRHLIWDMGIGLDKVQATRSSWLVVVLTIVMTLGYWLIIQG
jgi:succinate dehydrogenase / fumarate reductase cytochrome b subunit